jgi:hypothetical protein
MKSRIAGLFLMTACILFLLIRSIRDLIHPV